MLAKERSAMDDKNWPLTSRAVTDSEHATQGDYDLDDDDEPDLGFSLLHLLAEEGLIREFQPGRFYVSKLES
jgi:hypothetical protein